MSESACPIQTGETANFAPQQNAQTPKNKGFRH
jgi:hypothetical protein